MLVAALKEENMNLKQIAKSTVESVSSEKLETENASDERKKRLSVEKELELQVSFSIQILYIYVIKLLSTDDAQS